MFCFRKSESFAPDSGTPLFDKQARTKETSSVGEATTLPEKDVTIVSEDLPLPPLPPTPTQDINPQAEVIVDIPVVTMASVSKHTLAETTNRGKTIAQDVSSSQPVETKSDLCKGMEWPLRFSTLMLCALDDWSSSDPIDDPPIADLESEALQPSKELNVFDLNIVEPLQPSEDLSKFLTEMNKLEELQKQAAQSYEVQF